MTRAVTAALSNIPVLPEWIEPSLLKKKRLAVFFGCIAAIAYA
jgi:hypothetical protein